MKHLLFLGIAFVAVHISQSIPDFCQLSEDEGTGNQFIFSLYYDADNDRCNPFFYKGEGGNGNRFVNERECIRNCSSNSETLYPKDVTEACYFKKAPGGCNGQYLRYYYDAVHDKCKKFFWTGCFGNGNRFPDHDTCNATCAGIHDDRDDPEEDEPDTPIAIICGVLLGIILVAVIITGILLAVKSKKKGSKKKSGGKSQEAPAETPLQEQRIEMS
ncbi:kunitz-type serine protease inhibitor bitisilin-3-like [Cheilinus undulatus]|uniref:kunitz-type serine protease inhibitor bitisilin-3-like n=1 Tax=Cheilinus undulatus TaxID=241271 RepID=UPI001BD3F7B4|nr:kunitz-type serine protease inhibitor bitisilin-3-like [Cheilinus undulatus]